MTRRVFIVSALAAAAAGCSSGPEALEKGELTWSEEFDQLDLASSANPRGRWRPNDVWQPLDQGYGDFATGQHSTWLVNPAQPLAGLDFNPFSVTDSVLRISCTRTPPELQHLVDDCPWLGGLLVSNTELAEMSFGYGYYEFRARFSGPGRGMFPALWFYAAHGQNPDAQSTAEIDVFEILGSPSGRPWTSTLHGDEQVDVQSQDLDTAGWHTYGLDWAPEHMHFYYDDRRTAVAPPEQVRFFQGAKMSMRMNFVMDAPYFPPENTSDPANPQSLHFELDYVRRFEGLLLD